MTQKELNRLKDVAKEIGSWAEYGLMEVEYWAPHELDRITEDVLQKLEADSKKWLSIHKDEYPPSGAEEVLRAEITGQTKFKLSCLTEDEASAAEMMRMNGKPLSKILSRFKKGKIGESKPKNYLRETNETFEECLRGAIQWEKQYLERFDPPTSGDYLEWILKAKVLWDAEELKPEDVNSVWFSRRFSEPTITPITQPYLNKQKQLAHKIGPWAEFIITEVEHTAPLELDRFNEKVLRHLEYLCSHSGYDPTSSVDMDELKRLLKDLISSMNNSFYSSEKKKADKMRADGLTIEATLNALGKKSEIVRYENIGAKAKPNNFLRYVFKDFETGFIRYMHWKERWPDLDHFPTGKDYVSWAVEFEKLWEKNEL